MRFAMIVLGLIVLAGVGCSTTLETGYEPKELGSTSAERKGYYASPFSPEAAVSGRSTADDQRALRRP